MNKNEVEIHVKLDDLDEALEKANKLKELLQEVQTLICSLSGINRKDS